MVTAMLIELNLVLIVLGTKICENDNNGPSENNRKKITVSKKPLK